MTRKQRTLRQTIWWSSAITGFLFFLITVIAPEIGGLITQ